MITPVSISGSPRERFREMMRADILNAGRELLRQGGFAALSMRALAEAVGVRAPTLYDYFENKEAVLNALFIEGIGEVRRHFEPVIATTPPGVARIVGLGLAYRDFAVADPVLFQLVFGRIDANFIPGDEQMEASGQLYLLLRDEVEQAIALGEVEPADPDVLAMTFWAAVHGVVSLEQAGFLTKCAPGLETDMTAKMTEVVLFGVLTRSKHDAVAIGCPIAAALQPHPAG